MLRSTCRILGISSFSLALCGCLNLFDHYLTSQVCKPGAAREAGAEDARAGRPMDEAYGSRCGVAETSLNGMYREAYDAVPAQERIPRSWLDRLLGRRAAPSSAETSEAR